MESMGATSIGAPQIAGGRVPAMLIPLPSLNPSQAFGSAILMAFGTTSLDINPEKVQITRGTSKRTEVVDASVNNLGARNRFDAAQPTKISVSGVILEGMATKLKCETLLFFCKPLPQIPDLGLSPNVNEQPHLIFCWGPPIAGIFYEVTMDNVSISYERFNPMGIPIRASVTLAMSEEFNPLTTLATNPTSGGVANRREHIVSQGENLPTIARSYYGSVGTWRPLAEINGIDNPFGIHPGQRIYIPSQSELPQGGS